MKLPRARRPGFVSLCGALAIILAAAAARGADLEPASGVESPRAGSTRGSGKGATSGALFAPEEFLMSARESEVFRALRHPAIRARFLERFWQQRDTDLRGAWTRRLPLAADEFGDLASQRARIFLTAGPPQYRLAEICPPPVARHEIWVYDEGASQVVFVASSADGAYESWQANDWASLLEEAGATAPRQRILEACPRGEELLAVLSGGSEPATTSGSESRDPTWVEEFLEETTLLPTGARPLDASITLDYPASVGEKTAVVIALDIPKLDHAGGELLEFALNGEVFGAADSDAFRIRMSATAPDAGETLRLTARRHLAPGEYELVIRLHAVGDDRYFRSAVALEVPALDLQEEDWAVSGERLFKLQPPPEGYLTDSQRFSAVTSDPEIARVTFYLDGKRVLTKNRAPFSVELDLGVIPRPRTVEAVASNAEGYEVARDRLTVNSGPHRFAIRLVAPHHGERTGPAPRLHAEVDTPLGESLSHVDFYWNESHLARLHQPPFVQAIRPPPGAGSAYVRAVAVLDDGHSAEDLVVVNTGSTVDAIDVDFVELYASVRDRSGQALTGLTGEVFHVFENGVEQEIRRFETLENLPISAIVVLDSSTSMVEEIKQVEEAAVQFFEDVVQPKDRAAVVIFNDTPVLRVPLTNDLVLLENGLVGIEADGETSLYDSLIYGLYYLTGLRGKRALILISDGADSVSRFSFDDALEFAQRSGVAVYPIGLGLKSGDVAEHAVLRKLAHETGGECFFVESARRLDRIYDRIEDDLRSQYLLGYQSPQTDSRDYRRVKVETDRDGLEVKTVPGYYP